MGHAAHAGFDVVSVRSELARENGILFPSPRGARRRSFEFSHAKLQPSDKGHRQHADLSAAQSRRSEKEFIIRMIELANDNLELYDGTTKLVKDIIDASEVCMAIWPDLSKPNDSIQRRTPALIPKLRLFDLTQCEPFKSQISCTMGIVPAKESWSKC
jgi:hypothetical protein